MALTQRKTFKTGWRDASVKHNANAYRFGYEANTTLMKDFETNKFTSRYSGRKVFMPDNGDGSFTIHYSHDAVTGTQDDGIFLVGNPMMSHLVISKFTTANTAVSSLSTWNGQEGVNTIVIIDGQPVGTTDNGTTSSRLMPSSCRHIRRTMPIPRRST